MVDPVTLSTGQTYERANIQRWFSGGHFTCPITMQRIYDLSLTPNHTLRELIQDWYSRHGIRSKLQTELVGVDSDIASILAALPLTEEIKGLMVDPVCLSAIAGLLHEGRIDTRVNAANLIICFITGDEERRQTIATNPRVMPGIISLLHENMSSPALLAALHFLQVVCSTSNQIKLLTARSGAVLPLVNLLAHPNTNCIQQSLVVLEFLSTTHEGCSTINQYDNSIPNVVAVITRISDTCNQYALSILEAICRLDNMEKSAGQAVKAGAVVKLLLIIQSSCGARMKKRALNLLKLLMRHNILLDNTMLISDTELSHTLP